MERRLKAKIELCARVSSGTTLLLLSARTTPPALALLISFPFFSHRCCPGHRGSCLIPAVPLVLCHIALLFVLCPAP